MADRKRGSILRMQQYEDEQVLAERVVRSQRARLLDPRLDREATELRIGTEDEVDRVLTAG